MATFFPSAPNSPAAGRIAGKVGLAGGLVFSVIWLGMSGAFSFFGLSMFWKEWKQSDWQKVPCVVESFQILDDPGKDEPFTAKVAFQYEAGGKTRVGRNLYPAKTPSPEPEKTAESPDPGDQPVVSKKFSDYQRLAALQRQFLGSATADCLVDPTNPDNAALVVDREGLWGSAAFAAFGLCFVAIGLGVAVQSLRGGRRTGGVAVTGRTNGKEGFPLLIGLPFFGIFAAAGLGMFVFLSVPMLQGLMGARSRVAVPGTVVWSRVHSSGGSDGTTYKADIFYRYEFGGKEYKSNRDSFFNVSSGGRAKHESLVRAHPRGKIVTCHVNPDKPWDAVLDRSLSWSALFGLFPLPFLGVGLGGLWFLARRKSGTAAQAVTAGVAQPAARDGLTHGLPEASRGPVSLNPGKGRTVRVFGTLFATCFWNGLVSVFVYHCASEWRSGHGSWFLTLFLVPFVLVGSGLLAALAASIGAWFNPRPRLTLEHGNPRLGQPVPISWELPSGSSRLRDFRLVLRGEEVATYRRGTSTVTERSTFYEAKVFETSVPAMLAAGRATVRLPENLVSSWKAANNRIEWSLQVRGSIRFWPDLADSHDLTVLPAAV